jgi:hypothetical protein
LLNEVNSYGHIASFLSKTDLEELKTPIIGPNKLPKLNPKPPFASKKTALKEGHVIVIGKVRLKSDLPELRAGPKSSK